MVLGSLNARGPLFVPGLRATILLTPVIGTTLNHYRITAKLGEGGMGAVYAAEDSKLGRRVALKVLPAGLADDSDRLARFQREARAVAALNHPNIVVLHSVEESDGTHFLTMELVEGQPLSELIPEGGMPLEKLLEQGIALADAVSAAHDRGITHRDLKPANVMLNAEDRIKVLDFGLAKLSEPLPGDDDETQLQTASLTGEGKIVGTVAHMAPEQAEGKPVDARTDVFALGTILYQMATGERPFQGDTTVSVLSSIMKDTPSSVTEARPSLPRHLGRVISHCLEKNPEHRYQSAKDLRNELSGLEREIASGQLSGSEIEGPPSGVADPPPIQSGRRGLILGLAIVAALAIAAALYFTRAPVAPAAPTLYSFATADNITGTYYPLGVGLARLVERRIPGVAIEVLPTEGSFQNADLIDRGEAQLAYMQSDVAFHSVKTERVLGHVSEAIVGLAVLYREYGHILIRKEAGITAITDFPGHRVNINLASSGSRFTNDTLLDHFGIQLTDDEKVFLSSKDANIELLSGSLDASLQWVGLPHPAMLGVMRSGKVALLSIDPALARGLQTAQPFLLPGQIPAGTYPGQTEAVDTVVVKALLVGHRSLPDEFVAGVLDSLFAGVSDLIAVHPRAAEISVETAFGLENGMSIELHPAAEAWWRAQ